MKLENYEVHLPSYSIGDHIYDKIGPVCESYGKTVLLIGGRRALKAAEEKIRTYVAKTNLEIIGVELYGSDCTYETVEKLRQLPVYHKADMVFGVGGGKALDTVKCLCITARKSVFLYERVLSLFYPSFRNSGIYQILLIKKFRQRLRPTMMKNSPLLRLSQNHSKKRV